MRSQIYKEYSINDFTSAFSDTVLYLRKRYYKIILITLVFVVAGIVFSFFQADKFAAEVTFSNEVTNQEKNGSFSGIAAQLGIILANTDNYYEGRNVLEFLKRKTLLVEVLLSPTEIDGSKETFLDFYIRSHPPLYNFDINKIDTRQRDSILNTIVVKFLKNQLVVSKKTRESNLTTVTFFDSNEIFTKLFLEKFMANAIKYYSSYKTAKIQKDKQLLLYITDSLRKSIGQNIEESAILKDQNINVKKQLLQTNIQKKQFSIQVNSTMYNEVLKQLEFENSLLQQEKPFLEVIDKPIYPLENKKIKYLVAIVYFGLFGFIMAVIFFLIKRIIDNKNTFFYLYL